MNGMNVVKMRGYISWPKLSVTAKGYPKYTAKIAIPVTYQSAGEEKQGTSYHNICAWGPVAEALGDMLEKTPVEIEGTLNSRNYDSPCQSCQTPTKKYWTEVQVNNFIIVNE